MNEFAVELGCYASDLDANDYQKVPPPELSEIKENESDSNSLARHKKVLQYSPSIEQGRSPILHFLVWFCLAMRK